MTHSHIAEKFIIEFRPMEPKQGITAHAGCGKHVMDVYHFLTDSDHSCSLSNLLADLMHMCNCHPEFDTFEEGLDAAREHYEQDIGNG